MTPPTATSSLVVAVDVDDVLFPFSATVRHWAHESSARLLPPTRLLHGRLGATTALGWALWAHPRLAAWFLRGELAAAAPPLPHAAQALRALAADHTLVVVTARPASLAAVTQRWLDRHLPGVFSQVAHCDYRPGRAVPKALACQRLGASVLLDDRVCHLRAAAAAGLTALHYDPHHRATPRPGLLPVRCWSEMPGLLPAPA